MSVLKATQSRGIKPESGGICERNTSAIYSMLPSVVQSRIPVLRSLRQTAYDVVSRPLLYSGSISIHNKLVTKHQISRSETDSVSRSASTTGSSVVKLDRFDGQESRTTPPSGFDVGSPNQDLQSGGVDWFIAGVGVRLWLDARRQVELTGRDTMMLRSMHIDTLRYMNMAIPKDLSETEIVSIQDSLPSQILALSQKTTQTSSYQRPNMLRQSIAQAVCWVIAVLLIIIPLVMTVINRILLYEREHQITYRLLNSGSHATRTMGERGLMLGDRFARFKETPGGRSCLDLLSWIVDGVVGGVNDGFNQSASKHAGSYRREMLKQAC